MEIVPFKAEHLEMIELQPEQAGFSTQIADKQYGKSLEQAGNCFTGFVDGKVIGCSGLVFQWENRAVAWALLSKDAGKHMITVVRKIGEYLKFINVRRVEAFTTCDFPQGARMLKMLGFTLEGKAEKYTPDGKDCYLYSLVRG